MKKSAAIVGALLLTAPLLPAQETQPQAIPPPLIMTAPPQPTGPGSPMLTPTMTPVASPTTLPTAATPPATTPATPPTVVAPPSFPDGTMMPANAPGNPPAMDVPPIAAMPALDIPPAQPTSPPPPPATPVPETAPAQEKKPMEMPDFVGIAGWLNSEPLTKASLKGKVVLVDFWTYSCVNCLRTVPYLKEWYKKYKDRGFVIVGVHSPEFEFEKDVNNIKMAIQKLGITYPVAMDNQMATWAAFNNNVWPAHFFVDADGKVRHIHLGEGDYDQSEQMIQKLLTERDQPKPESQPAAPSTMPAETQTAAQPSTLPAETKPAESQPATPGRKRGRRSAAAAAETKPAAPTAAPAKPVENKPLPLPALSKNVPNVDFSQIKSPETYLGLMRRERLVTSGRPIEMNEWMYDGKWRTEGDRIVLSEGTGKISFRFNATKVNLVLAPTAGGVQAVVKIDGQPVPADKAGADVKNGTVMITEPRMYELLNLGTQGSEHIIEIEFLNPGAAAYAFTFG